MKKICIVITARPSYSRVRTLLKALRERSDVQVQIITAASFISNKFGEAVKVLQEDGFEPDWVLNTLLEADSPVTSGKTTGLQTLELSTAFDNLKPDMVVTVADRYETIAASIAASYANIPLVHIQGGEVTGNIDEKVRHANTKMADLHLVCTDKAAERVSRLGECREVIHNVGCPSIDIAKEVLGDSAAIDAFDPFFRYTGVGEKIDVNSSYVVVMQHPVTTEPGSARQQITETLQAVQSLDIPAIVMWPNPDAGTEGTSEGIRIFRELENPKQFYFFKNMRPGDFLRLLFKSSCLIGNSSVGIRECSYLGVPVVNIGTRQAYRERRPNVIDSDYERENIVGAIRTHLDHGQYESSGIYGNGDSGVKAAKILAESNPPTYKVLTY